MMDRTWQPPAQLSASDALPPAGLGANPDRAIRSASLTAGVGLLLMSALAGFGYTFDSFVAVFSSNPLIEVATFTFVGEFLLALWLVIRGRRLTLSKSRHHGDPTAVAR